jgi:hypothetical protein
LNRDENAFDITKNLIVPETKHSVAFVIQTTIPNLVRNGSIVLSAVCFNDQTLLTANKIANILADRYLSDELMAVDLPVTNSIPENSLCVGLICTQTPGNPNSLFIVTAHYPVSYLNVYPTSPCIGFTGALSGNTVSASMRSARPN